MFLKIFVSCVFTIDHWSIFMMTDLKYMLDNTDISAVLVLASV